MKSLYVILPVSLVVGMIPAFAEIDDLEVSLRYDDRVELFGVVEVKSLEERMNLVPVKLEVFNSDGNLVFTDEDRPDAEGEFSFNIPRSELSDFGEYEAKVSYYDDSDETDFELEN